MDRRNFLSAMLAAGAAPAIVKASSLMVVRKPPITPVGFFEFDGVDDYMTQKECKDWLRAVVERARQSGKVYWFDPSVVSSLYQDAAGTIPVTAPGQPVGRILDLSGEGDDAIAIGSLPIYRVTADGQPYLQNEDSVGPKNMLKRALSEKSIFQRKTALSWRG